MMENFVDYKIYFKSHLTLGELEKESETENLAKVLSYLEPIIGDYIWQNQPFALQISDGTDEVPACLHGYTDFGDNIEDEWFIVYLLFELTKKFPEVALSICDTDGEFLLIEAANYLPRWLSPETSQNRVFVQGGQINIVPIPQTPAEVTVYPAIVPSIAVALKLVFGPSNTLPSQAVQQAISSRLQGYPGHARQSKHHANCYVPAAVNFLLNQQPSLISPMVRAFCERDPLDLKLCRGIKHFKPDTCVMRRVQFTRCLYAQLVQQDFWPEKLSVWKLPSKSNPQCKAYELGMKLAYGCEILCARCSGESKEEWQPSGAKWETFLASLEKNGYFKGEIKGSKLYKHLMEKAKQEFCNSFSENNRKESNPGDVMLLLLRDADIDVDAMREESKQLPQEDDDKWLEISAEELDEMLSCYSIKKQPHGPSAEFPSQNGADGKAGFDLDQVTRSMKSFVDTMSSHEGAEFPWTADNQDIQFNADSFADTVKRLFEESDKRDSDAIDDIMNLSDDDIIEDEDGSLEIEDEEEEDNMRAYMDQMDQELSHTTLGKSFEKEPKHPSEVESSPRSESREDSRESTKVDESNEGGEECLRPVDVDLNLVRNLLESYSLQQGLAGPASNILNALGVSLPQDSDKL